MSDLNELELRTIHGGDGETWDWHDFWSGVGWTFVAVGGATGNAPVAMAGAVIEGVLWLTSL